MVPTVRYQNATDVRINFSKILDNAVYSKPQFIKRTHNHIIMIGADMFSALLSEAKLHLSFIEGEDGSKIAVCDEIDDIIGVGDSSEEAIAHFIENLVEYAEEYYKDYKLYSRAVNRKQHLPFIMNVLAADSIENVKEMLICQAGRN